MCSSGSFETGTIPALRDEATAAETADTVSGAMPVEQSLLLFAEGFADVPFGLSGRIGTARACAVDAGSEFERDGTR